MAFSEYPNFNIKGFGLTPLSGDRRGYMPPLLKTKQRLLGLMHRVDGAEHQTALNANKPKLVVCGKCNASHQTHSI